MLISSIIAEKSNIFQIVFQAVRYKQPRRKQHYCKHKASRPRSALQPGEHGRGHQQLQHRLARCRKRQRKAHKRYAFAFVKGRLQHKAGILPHIVFRLFPFLFFLLSFFRILLAFHSLFLPRFILGCAVQAPPAYAPRRIRRTGYTYAQRPFFISLLRIIIIA